MISNYLKSALNEQIFNAGTAYSPPGTFYLAVFSDDPLPDASGTEAVGGTPAYARLALAWELLGDDYYNNADLSVDLPAGTFTFGAVFDDPSAGNMLLYGAFVAPIVLSADGPALIPQDTIRALLS